MPEEREIKDMVEEMLVKSEMEIEEFDGRGL
jgi:hypothetical protein